MEGRCLKEGKIDSREDLINSEARMMRASFRFNLLQYNKLAFGAERVGFEQRFKYYYKIPL
jgi:hypothetical protein